MLWCLAGYIDATLLQGGSAGRSSLTTILLVSNCYAWFTDSVTPVLCTGLQWFICPMRHAQKCLYVLSACHLARSWFRNVAVGPRAPGDRFNSWTDSVPRNVLTFRDLVHEAETFWTRTEYCLNQPVEKFPALIKTARPRLNHTRANLQVPILLSILIRSSGSCFYFLRLLA